MSRDASAQLRGRFGRLLSLTLAGVLFSACLGLAVPALGVTFDPAKVISDDNFRAYDSLSQEDIQAFLNRSPVLASYTATDMATGKQGSAAQIIFNAAQQFHISPKVIITMLQKEQSLITRSKASLVTGKYATLDWALGMGCPDSYGDLSKKTGCYISGCHTSQPSMKRLPEYRGFSNQIWAAAMSLNAYGEKGQFRPQWHHITTKHAESASWSATSSKIDVQTPTGTIYGMTFSNIATFKLYTYNPSIGAKKPYGDLSSQAGASWMGGNANFWLIYRKYFGDTFANPRVRAVYRYRDTKTGAYLYTSRMAERYQLSNNARYAKEGLAFSWDASNTANSIPVYRFMNRKTRGYLFTASASAYTRYTTTSLKKTWRYEGVAFMASAHVTGAKPIYRFANKKTGLIFLTSSASEKAKFQSSTYASKWTYLGIPYWICP